MLAEQNLTETEDSTAAASGRWGLALPEVGEVVDNRYRITRLIGAGGMGTVFEAETVSVGRRCALKFLHCQRACHSHSGHRFEREARLLARLEHDHLTIVLDSGRFREDTPYYAMEYLEGETLKAALQREGPMPTGAALQLMQQICRGMAHAHRNGVVHRDLKPDNLMLIERSDGQRWIKILDFGVARWTEDPDSPLTPTGAELGTAHYMSPEQARGAKNIDARADVYSLGAILYEMLAGRRVHPGGSYNEVLFQLLTQPHQRLGEVLKGCPRAIEDLVERCLRRDAEERFCDAGEMLDAVSRISMPAGVAPDTAAILAPVGERAGQAKPGLRARALCVLTGAAIGAALAQGATRVGSEAPRAVLYPRQESLQTSASANAQPASSPSPRAREVVPAAVAAAPLERQAPPPPPQLQNVAPRVAEKRPPKLTSTLTKSPIVNGAEQSSAPRPDEFPFLTANPYLEH